MLWVGVKGPGLAATSLGSQVCSIEDQIQTLLNFICALTSIYTGYSLLRFAYNVQLRRGGAWERDKVGAHSSCLCIIDNAETSSALQVWSISDHHVK